MLNELEKKRELAIKKVKQMNHTELINIQIFISGMEAMKQQPKQQEQQKQLA